jgi:hypothetical protein
MTFSNALSNSSKLSMADSSDLSSSRITLPAQRLNQELVFKASKRRLSYILARLFYLTWALLVVISAILFMIPSFFVPSSESFQRSRTMLSNNRVLRRYLGPPLRVAKEPETYLKEGPLWHFLIAVEGREFNDMIRVSVKQEGQQIKLLKAHYKGWDLLTGEALNRKISKKIRKPH